jgi:NADH-quinone oxidoreductase subunit F
MKQIEKAEDLQPLARSRVEERDNVRLTLIIPNGTCCQASGSLEVIDAVKAELAKHGIEKDVRVRETGCHGFCELEPLMVFEPGNLFYCHVTPADVEEIIFKTVINGETVDRLAYTDSTSGEKIVTEKDIPFYRVQDRQLLSYHKLIDPRNVDDYIATGGYQALAATLDKTAPEEVIEAIKASGLRGRGGAGFSTGRKWHQCWEVESDEKYVICNADEGDPGAYMDRCILESNPHLVLEGMMIGAWAVGADKGYIYVRNEYPLAVKHARIAIEQARERGLLGDNILGSSFSFAVEVARGGGAFVCGESTALMASLEGKVGEPRPKDVHTVVDGIWHKPTTLNNVETWANVPSIVSNGSAWFAAKGTDGSKGTKILALTGQVKNTGLVEVPMGTTIKDIVFTIGGGPKNGNAIKAVQTGGPSGGCLPASKFDMHIDFDALYEAGSMMGSGGMVVMDDSTCMVDVAKYFLNFLQDESCGKCVPCRLGVNRMLEIITDITEGRAKPGQIDLLEELAETVSETALCGLGKSASNPVLSTLRYFRGEYETHINEQRCPAGMCRALITYTVDEKNCNGCGVCLRACPNEAITGEKKQLHVINADSCDRCGICRSECRFDAINVN